jgi:hypothetical protein
MHASAAYSKQIGLHCGSTATTPPSAEKCDEERTLRLVVVGAQAQMLLRAGTPRLNTEAAAPSSAYASWREGVGRALVVVRPAESRNSRVCAMSSAVRAKLRLTKSTSNSPARDCRPRAPPSQPPRGVAISDFPPRPRCRGRPLCERALRRRPACSAALQRGAWRWPAPGGAKLCAAQSRKDSSMPACPPACEACSGREAGFAAPSARPCLPGSGSRAASRQSATCLP